MGTCRSSPDIIFSDTVILFSVCKSSIQVTGFLIDYLSSKARNKLAHSINGNHPSSTSPRQISLDALVPPSNTLTDLFSQRTQLSRTFLLQCKPQHSTHPEAVLPVLSQRPGHRSSRILSRYNPLQGIRSFYHSRLQRRIYRLTPDTPDFF